MQSGVSINTLGRLLRRLQRSLTDAAGYGAANISGRYRATAGVLRKGSDSFACGDLDAAMETRAAGHIPTDDDPTGPIPRICSSPERRSVLSELGAQVDELAALSPTLCAGIDEIHGDGWKVKYDDTIGGGAYSDRQRKEILVFPDSDPEKVLVALAHEIGHSRQAAYRPSPIRYEGQPRDAWIRQSVFEHLRDEGEAALTEAEILYDISRSGGPPLRVSGRFGLEYEKIGEQFMRGEMTRDEARDEIARWFGGESRSGSGRTYQEHYEEVYVREFSEMGLDAFEKKYRKD